MALQELFPPNNEILGLKPEELFQWAAHEHPETSCVKEVFGWLMMKIGDKQVQVAARNNLPGATPEMLRWFSHKSLEQMASQITDDYHLKTAILERLTELHPDTPVNCIMLHQLVGSICLKGFSWDNPKARASRDSRFCPNSRANGCAERTIIHWLPYIIEFTRQFNETGPLKIHGVFFYDPDRGPNLEYYDEEGKIQTHNFDRQLTYDNVDRSIVGSMTFGTSLTPCIHCAKAFTDLAPKFPGGIEIIAERPSRYIEGKSHLVDPNDINATNTLRQAGIALSFLDHKVKPRQTPQVPKYRSP